MSVIVGQKREMTQIFDKGGRVVPCTIVDVSNTKVVALRTLKRDGYDAIILGFGKKKKPKKVEIGKYKKLKYVPQFVCEFRKERIDKEKDYAIGDEVKAAAFNIGDKVDVTGVTKGKGFQGVVRRWGFKGGPRTHGQSDRERAPGSIGGGTDPGRVFKGKKMPGHMGMRTKTVLNLEVVKIDTKNDLLCIKGALPGWRNSYLKIRKKG